MTDLPLVVERLTIRCQQPEGITIKAETPVVIVG